LPSFGRSCVIRTPFDYLPALAVRCRGVIHVGANRGQEVDAYAGHRVRHALLVEPLATPFEQLCEAVKPHRHYHAVRALCGARDGEIRIINVASNNGESSSILPPADHLDLHPSVTFDSTETMVAKTLDGLVADFLLARPTFTMGHFDVLVVDVQGAELEVLRGAERTLAAMKVVWCEVAHAELYRGNARFEDVQSYLSERGFKLFWTQINRRLWGDALFVRPEEVGKPREMPLLSGG